MVVSNMHAPVIVCALPGFVGHATDGLTTDGLTTDGIEVRSVEVAAVDAVVAHLATYEGRRFVLAGAGAEAAVVAAVVRRLLSGEAPVFGLVGVALAAPEGDLGAEVLDLPTVVIADEATHLVRPTGEAASGGVKGASGAGIAGTFPRARVGRLAAFVAREVSAAPEVPDDWARLIASDRVDVEVRSILARRALPDDPGYEPQTMDAAHLALLRQIADLVVPQDSPAIDLAARVDAQLARGEGDGWRHAALPPDPEAYRAGLSTLAPVWAGEQTLRAAIDGDLDVEGAFGAAQLAVWLDDVRVDLVRQWLAHPAIAARAGFDGFATGGTVLPLRGFTELGAGRREAWEPAGVNA